jgi:ArsR family metal-binding transcriptional regulator
MALLFDCFMEGPDLMDPLTFKRPGYSFSLVNIDCLPHSTHFNVLMDLDVPVESLLPYLAACLPACTYVHGTGVVQLMDRGHIVAIYPDRLTITDVPDTAEAEALCAEYFAMIERVERERPQITPALRKLRSISVLDIYRQLPQTNCSLCGLPTCFAFAAAVYRQESSIGACKPVETAAADFEELIELLQANGYPTP